MSITSNTWIRSYTERPGQDNSAILHAVGMHARAGQPSGHDQERDGRSRKRLLDAVEAAQDHSRDDDDDDDIDKDSHASPPSSEQPVTSGDGKEPPEAHNILKDTDELGIDTADDGVQELFLNEKFLIVLPGEHELDGCAKWIIQWPRVVSVP